MKHLSTTIALAFSMFSYAQENPINIDLQQRGADVSPNLYGIFFEEINHAGDGGLYAELVQNRGFEEHVLPLAMHYENGHAVGVDSPNYYSGVHKKWSIDWNLEEKKYLGWSVKGNACVVAREVKEMAKPLHRNTPNAMQLTISNMRDGGSARLINSGYWGMGISKGEKYDLRFYVRSADYQGTIGAEITDSETGQVLGRVNLKKKNIKEWTEYTGVITGKGTTAKGQLELVFTAPGTVFVDYVSLFPRHTFKNRRNGLRPDLARMLQGLHPKFMRWPGGCIVEGATFANRVKWKETLGDPMTRPGEWDLWGYRADWGMGYHEFLQFCEDLGMNGMFVGNAGLSCTWRNGDYVDTQEELDAVVQDFRDAIEYALGDPATNKWAKMRADAGHPKPFPLKYVEIGNENFDPMYVKHFNYIYGFLQKEYPQIIFINNLNHTDPLLSQMPGDYMVDPHWYVNPDYFFNNNHLFDQASRAHDIYVGEYACNSGVGGGNLLAAISEAAFILGMERNSDVVKMASYAPLFENVNHKDWTCNLIHYNSNQTYGRASYYVQKMAAENRPTYNVFVDETTREISTGPFRAGGIGLGSYATDCEFRNVKIAQNNQVTEYGPRRFEHKKGVWEVNGDVLSQHSDQTNTLSQLSGFKSDNYTLTLQARRTGGREGFFIYYGLDDSGRNGYGVNVAGWDNKATAVQPMGNGVTDGYVSEKVGQTLDNDRWYDVKLVVTPETATLYIDGKIITTAKPMTKTRQYCQTGYDEQTHELVIKVVNGTEEPYKRAFNIQGVDRVEARGRVITLAGDATAENTFQEPEKLSPSTTGYDGFAKQFSYQFAPMSFTILRIKVADKSLRR